MIWLYPILNKLSITDGDGFYGTHWHKLILSQERDASASDKKRKDIAQAANLLSLLKEDRPGDIDIAREELTKHGASWVKKLMAACREGSIAL